MATSPYKASPNFNLPPRAWLSDFGYPRSSSPMLTEKGVLLISFDHTATMKNRAFSVVSPVVWNAIPLDVYAYTLRLYLNPSSTNLKL